ncbi:hypothetical protein H2201_004010 [Coniosporium apollinis]|uniref:Uncharacterized protein n=1 Tax=Coniosporium apollinis TaxID=61459 RepID=A0ABQ9NXW3_9PEZI|nr:hypothetical protein H2201_004010 [Coniosporium apollinis]
MSTQTLSPLLRTLPPELRVLIYNEVLTSYLPKFRDHRPIPASELLVYDCAYPRRVGVDVKDKSLFREPALLNTCRQIRAEMLSLYYGKYGFLVWVGLRDDYKAFASWLRRIRKDGVEALRHVVYRGMVDCSPPVVPWYPGRRRPAARPPVNVMVEVSIRLPQKNPDSVYRVETRILAPDHDLPEPQHMGTAEEKLETICQRITERIEASITKEGGLELDAHLAVWSMIHRVLDQGYGED